VLPARGAKPVNHPALPYAELPAFMGALAKRDGIAVKALLFTILTAARRGETLGAQWSEIDFAKKTWTVPAGRMKAGATHIVPLSPAAIDLLRALPRESGGDGFVFIGSRMGRGLAHDAMGGELDDMGRRDLTVHGFRSSFADWVSEQTAYSYDIREAALAHAVGDKSERAYSRTTQLARRRQLMEQWAAFCMTAPVVVAGDNVVGLGR
jgi:integrase